MKKQWIIALVGLSMLLAGCKSNNNTLEKAGDNQEKRTVQSTDKKDSSSDSAVQFPEVKVTVAQAIQAYEKAYPETVLTSLELDTSFGEYRYELKGVDDSKEYQLKVHAQTGAITKEREEVLDQEDQKGVAKEQEALDLKGLKDLNEITQIAVTAIGQGNAVEWSLERELATTYWEVTIHSGNQDASVKINAQTGEVIEKEIDSKK